MNELRTLEEHFLSKYGFKPIVTNIKHAYADPPYVERKVQWKEKLTDDVYFKLLAILGDYGFRVGNCKDASELKRRVIGTLIYINGDIDSADTRNEIYEYLHNRYGKEG